MERQLRGVLADSCAISGKEHAALFHATGMRQSDVYGAHGLFLGSAAWARNAREAHAQRAADVAADTVGKGDRDFTADRAFGLDEFRRNIRPGRLPFVAVAHHSAKEIR